MKNQLRYITIISSLSYFLLSSSSSPTEKPAHGEPKKEEKKSAHGEPKKEAKKSAHGEPKKEGDGKEIVARPPDSPWVKMPSFAALKAQKTKEVYNYAPRDGISTVIFFLASWCVPCQQMAPDLLALERKYSDKNVEFIYIFSQDTPDDISAFLSSYGFNKSGEQAIHLRSNDKIQDAFYSPQLPSFYVSDRKTWMSMRALGKKFNPKRMADLDEYLGYITAF